MKEILTFAGVPVAVLLSFALALGIEVLLLSSAIGLMHRAVEANQRSAADRGPTAHSKPFDVRSSA